MFTIISSIGAMMCLMGLIMILVRQLFMTRIVSLEETIRTLRRTIEHKTHDIHGCVLEDIAIRTRLVQLGIQESDEYGPLATMMMVETLIERKDHAIQEVCRLLREHMTRKGEL